MYPRIQKDGTVKVIAKWAEAKIGLNFLPATTVAEMVAGFQAATRQTGYSGFAFPDEPKATDSKKQPFDPKATIQSLFLQAGSLHYTLPDAMPTLYITG